MNLAALDLNLLLVYEALFLERRVGRAGKRIGLSQPAVSNALGRLRAALGDPLFVRSGAGMVPTARAIELSRPVLEALEQIRAAVAVGKIFDPSLADHRFRFHASDYGETVVIAPLLGRLRTAAPNITLQVRRATALFALPLEELLSDLTDYAVGFFPDALPPGSGLRKSVLMRERLAVLSGPHGPRRLTLREFARAPQIRVNLGRESPGLIDDALAQRKLERRIAITVPDFGCIPAVVADTDLIGVLPERLARFYAARFRLRTHRLPLAIGPLEVSAVWHLRNDDHPAHLWLRSMLAVVTRHPFTQ